MVDELKSIRNNLFKVISSLSNSSDGEDDGEGDEVDDEKSPLLDARAARALLGAVFSRAGKSKDDIIQILAREIGVAVAAMLKEPLAELAKHQKLQISFELVPKSGQSKPAAAGAAKEKKPKPPRPTGKHSPRAKKPGKGAV